MLADLPGERAGAEGYPTPVASIGIESSKYVTWVPSVAGSLTIEIRPFAWLPGFPGPVESTHANRRNASTLATGNADLVPLILLALQPTLRNYRTPCYYWGSGGKNQAHPKLCDAHHKNRRDKEYKSW
jgi:hypothetical protein